MHMSRRFRSASSDEHLVMIIHQGVVEYSAKNRWNFLIFRYLVEIKGKLFGHD